jgi:hypothetical protein
MMKTVAALPGAADLCAAVMAQTLSAPAIAVAGPCGKSAWIAEAPGVGAQAVSHASGICSRDPNGEEACAAVRARTRRKDGLGGAPARDSAPRPCSADA